MATDQTTDQTVEATSLQSKIEALFEPGTPLVFISADVDRVQSYVFESAKLAEMRGASLILDLLNAKKSDDDKEWGDVRVNKKAIQGIPQLLAELGLPRECLIYAAGGGALLLAPQARAEEIGRRIQRLYSKTTLTATISVVAESSVLPDTESLQAKAPQAKGEAWRLLKHNLVDEAQWDQRQSPADLGEDDFQRLQRFGHLYNLLGYALRREKQSKSTAPLFEVSSFTERCAYCHLRPAVTVARELDERPICEACDRKRQERGERAAHSFYLQKFWSFLEKEAEQKRFLPYWEGLREDKDLANWDDVESARDLEEIAKAAPSKVNNFVGIIYADGNNMGAILDQIESPEAFKLFAKEVRCNIERSVFSGLGHLLTGHRQDQREFLGANGRKYDKKCKYHPFEIVSIGGDDVYLFVPADVTLELALHICKEFEQACRSSSNLYVKDLTLAAGVLIAHVTTPVYFSRHIVKGLLKNAKRLSKSQPRTISAIDFQVITADTAITEEIKPFRDQTYRNRFKEGLTIRPLTLKQLESLIEQARAMKAEAFPKSQLYALRDAVVRGPQPRTTNYYYYQQSRNDRMKEQYASLHQYLLSEGKSEKNLPFWKPANKLEKIDFVTSLVDLVEIYDFILPAGKDKEKS